MAKTKFSKAVREYCETLNREETLAATRDAVANWGLGGYAAPHDAPAEIGELIEAIGGKLEEVRPLVDRLDSILGRVAG